MNGSLFGEPHVPGKHILVDTKKTGSYRQKKKFHDILSFTQATNILVKSLKNPDYQESVFTLDFECDWGSAKEYMDIAIDISEKAAGEDFVLGTGITWNAREFVKILFSKRGLDYRNHVLEENQKPSSGSMATSYTVILDKLEETFSRRPKRSILEVCDDILYHKYGIEPVA